MERVHVEAKIFARERLSDGWTAEQITEALERRLLNVGPRRKIYRVL